MNPRSLPTFDAIVFVLVLWRLVELVHSRHNVARRGGRKAGSDAAWRAMVGLHVLWFVAPVCEAHWRGRVAPPWLWWSALGLLALATGLRLWVLARLGSAWNARAVVPGDVEIVTDGPYRWIRHPNYLAVVMEFLALPLAGGAWWSLVVLNGLHAFVLRERIRAEERLLGELPGYRAAMRDRGGLLPRWPR